MQELRDAIQIAVDNECVDFGFGNAGQRLLRVPLNFNIHVETREDTFQNAHFLPVARDHHRGECHALTVARPVMAS